MPVTNGVIPATIHVGKVLSQWPKEDYVTIEVTDEASGARFLEVQLTLAEAAHAFLFNGHVDIKAEVRGLSVLGMVREVKTIVLDIDRDNWDDRVTIAAQHEVDGWVASSYDLGKWNHHRSTGKGGYKVGYSRYVEAEDEATPTEG